MAKLYKISDWREGLANVYFTCPGCKCDHGVWTEQWVKDNNPDGSPIYGPIWEFNGDMNKPTFKPSILVQSSYADKHEVCHSFVTDGKIQYLGDCTHELAGQTVEIPDIE
jgi:hypothetical protein